MKSVEYILNELEYHKGEYGLENVELTMEDAESAVSLMAEGIPEREAVDTILDGIRDCLSDGLGY